MPTLDGTPRETRHRRDGVQLAVYEAGPTRAPLTVVFVHGYTVTAECWAIQVRELADPSVRIVLYDQRGHGASQVGPPKDDTIEQLGHDLVRGLASSACPPARSCSSVTAWAA